MQLSRFLFRIALLVLPVALLGTTWLYLYPIFHGCGFPAPPPTHAQSIAPFRLLSLGDPQLEGDSSLPNPDAVIFPSLEFFIPHMRDATTLAERRETVKQATKGVTRDTGRWLEGKRKSIDLWGNDWYLAHIVRSLRWWTEPTHITVLGDLLGSQWVTNGEFRKRASRYWEIVMWGLENVPDHIFGVQDAEVEEVVKDESVNGEVDQEEGTEWGEDSTKIRKTAWGGTTEVLGADKAWEKRVINIAGNHDVGYAGDLDESRVERFERAFGSLNWDIWFTLPEELRANRTSDSPDPPPALRLVILNSMNLDTPAYSTELQTETYQFTNHIITNSRAVDDKTHATVLLTHIPLEKEAGICVDSPYFDFFEGGQGMKEQNMLSDHSSEIVLQGIFGMSGSKDAVGGGLGRRGIILNGHDHAGCDVVHYIRQPGVEGKCQVDLIKREEAYWPVVVANESMVVPSMESDGIEDMAALSNDTETSSDPESLSKPPLESLDPLLGPSPETPPESSTESAPESSADPAPDTTPKWRARRFPSLPYDIDDQNSCLAINDAPHIREITLRSMMGEYSGYAGFLSAWFDHSLGEKGEWVFEFSTCGVGVQHWWWAVHIFDLIALVAVLAGSMVWGAETLILKSKTDARKPKEPADLKTKNQPSAQTVKVTRELTIVADGMKRSILEGTTGKA